MSRLAFMTIGILREPGDAPAMQSFFDEVPPTFEAAVYSDGNAGLATGDAPEWGPPALPRFSEREAFLNRRVVTLSLWDDLESVFAYAYNGQHGAALARRKEWFEPPEWPGYVAWWIADDHTPSWQEASDRLDLLHDNGPTPDAFNFGHPFDAAGRPVRIDREIARAKARKNAGAPHGA